MSFIYLSCTLCSSSGTSSSQKSSGGRSSSRTLNGPTESYPRHAQDANSSDTYGKGVLGEKRASTPNARASTPNARASTPNASSRLHAVKPNNSQPSPATLASSSSAVGVYSSSTDPVHVPSPDSRSSGPVGAIKREVGVVGVRRQSSENSIKQQSVPSSSFSNSILGKDGSSAESFRPLNAISRTDQLSQATTTDSVMPSMPVNRPLLNNQYSSRPHQLVGHQKGTFVKHELYC